jgi:nicotinate-nucleotide adenylyltransferase
VVGSDLVDEIPRWREAARLVEIAPLLVVPRPRTSAEAEAGFALPALSSTSIREALAAGGPPPLALPHAVAAYIRDHSLYAPTG